MTIRTDPTDDDRRWMGLALEAAHEAHARGDWPTGCVLVKDGRLLASGQNRQSTQGDLTAHAETDASRAAFSEHGPEAAVGATLYCTMEPCPMCAGALKLAGVTSLVLALRHARLRRTDLGDYSIEAFCRMTGFQLALRDGVLEEDYLALRLRWGRDPVAAAD
jgi:tRNA(adenine34) deaminase